jgi:hypothetical protein
VANERWDNNYNSRWDSNNNWWEDHDNDRNDFDNNATPVITQEFDQESESGDVDQSFDVFGTGDNSNQTVGGQGVANTGNAQNRIGVTQFGSDADDFEFENVGSSIEVSPTNTTSSDQEVNQAASAFGSYMRQAATRPRLRTRPRTKKGRGSYTPALLMPFGFREDLLLATE